MLEAMLAPASPVHVVAIVALALLIAKAMISKFGTPSDDGRLTSIDGLRGYLAIFVFANHACVWYFYIKTGAWERPPSNLYSQLGDGSVVVFFMITAFLFFSKLINAKSSGIDWGRLFVARFLRLAPLYLVFMLLFFALVAYLSDWKLNDPVSVVMGDALQWLGFRMLGAPEINGVDDVSSTVAGITWTLSFEWFFYLSLPLLALLVRVRAPAPYVVLGIASVATLALSNPSVRMLLPFAAGAVVAHGVRQGWFRPFALTSAASWIAIGCTVGAPLYSPSGYSLVSLALYSVAFFIVASGNSIFGALTSPLSRSLGELSFGIYLLHSLILFMAFNFVVGVPEAQGLSAAGHWLVVLATTPVIVLLARLSFRYIESPAIRSTTKVTRWLRSRLSRVATFRADRR
jgi:peptidoglycan/LPS O-acetylase OafA/YrhL